jgi:hypothetical protein
MPTKRSWAASATAVGDGRAVSLILETINRINQILDSLAREQIEPEGNDEELIGNLARMVEALAADDPPKRTVGYLVQQVLERPPMPGDLSLDGFERGLRGMPPTRRRFARSPRRKLKCPRAARPEHSRIAWPWIRSSG